MFPVNFEISKTHLLSRKKQTLVAMLGVTFGIAMFILMISFMQGVNRFLENTLLQATPDIHIYNDIKTDYSQSIAGDYYKNGELTIVRHPKPKQITPNIKNAEQIITDLQKNTDVAVVSPHISTQVFYNYGPVQINGLIDGVDIMQEARLFGIANKMVTGKIENIRTTNDGIIMGQGLADKLNVKMGDMISLATPMGTSMRFRIVGTFQIGIGTIDNLKSYVNTVSVQQLLGKDRNYITDINIKLKDIKNAKPFAAVFQKKYNYKSEDWETSNASIMSTFIIRNILTYVVSITLLVVAGFGIYNIMSMTINSKMKDIAILKAQGFASKDIIQIFLSQSLIIGILGALSGMAIGFGLSLLLSYVPFPKTDFASMKYLPIIFELKYYLGAVFFGIITTFIAGVMPSIKASKVDPVVILRG